MALELEVDFIELIVTIILFAVSYFLAVKVFDFKEKAWLATAIFSLFIILMLMALGYNLYTSFAVIVGMSGIVIYANLREKGVENNEISG